MGAAHVLRRANDTVEIRYEGHLTGDDFAVVAQSLKAMTVAGRVRFLIADMQQLTGIDRSVRSAGVESVSILRDQHLELIVCIGAHPLLRVAAATIALIARVPIAFVTTGAEASRLLADRCLLPTVR